MLMSLLMPYLPHLITALLLMMLAYAGKKLREALLRNAKLAALSVAEGKLETAISAGIQAAGEHPGKPSMATLKAALAATEASLLVSWPTIEASLGAELSLVLQAHAAVVAPTVATAPGGASVTMPTPIAPTGGFVDLRLLLALSTFGVGAIVGWAVHGRYREWRTRRGRWPLRSIAAVLLGLAFALPARAQTAPAAPAQPVLVQPASTAPAAGATSVAVSVGPVDWKHVVFQHGPSLPLFVVNPHDLHPIKVAPGAGYYAGICLGQTRVNGAATSLLCVSGDAFLSVISPKETPEGGVQVALMLGTLGNALAVGPLLTPWTADGNGFLQGGRPGTSWAASIDPVAVWHLLGGP